MIFQEAEKAHLQFEMLNNGFENLHPVLLQRSVTVAWHWDLSHLSKGTVDTNSMT